MGTTSAASASAMVMSGTRSGANRPASVGRPPLAHAEKDGAGGGAYGCSRCPRSLSRCAMARATDS
eukprot:4691422-Lingulodinium_polyedra.AAC.1